MSWLGLRRTIFAAGTGLVLCACNGAEFQSDGAGGTAGSGSAGKSGGGSGNSGGSSANGGANSGGSKASGGSSAGSVSTGGSGGSVASACPPEVPVQGEPCQGNTECSYGECCPTQVLCVGGAWQVYPSACPQPICPPSPPLAGDDCTCQPDNCRYDMCANGQGITVAQCRVDGWAIQGEPCQASCNGQLCAAAQICLVNSNEMNTTYSCEPNPCPDDFSCTCLGPMLCPAGQQCLNADPATHTLSCTCPNCA